MRTIKDRRIGEGASHRGSESEDRWASDDGLLIRSIALVLRIWVAISLLPLILLLGAVTGLIWAALTVRWAFHQAVVWVRRMVLPPSGCPTPHRS